MAQITLKLERLWTSQASTTLDRGKHYGCLGCGDLPCAFVGKSRGRLNCLLYYNTIDTLAFYLEGPQNDLVQKYVPCDYTAHKMTYFRNTYHVIIVRAFSPRYSSKVLSCASFSTRFMFTTLFLGFSYMQPSFFTTPTIYTLYVGCTS